MKPCSKSTTRGPVTTILGLVLLIIGSAAVCPEASAQPSNQSAISAFVGFLNGQDVVVHGTLVSADSVRRAPPGGCGSVQETPVDGVDVHIRVSSVDVGVAEDSVLVITVLGRRGPYPATQLVAGTTVIGWGRRSCVDGWRLWGGITIITSWGRMLPARDQLSFLTENGFSGRVPITGSDLTAMLSSTVATTSAAAFTGGSGVALVRLNAMTSEPGPLEFSYSCDSLGWLFPTSGPFPTSLHFIRDPDCSPTFGPGDTLLVPISGTQATSAFDFDHVCPRGWRVKEGYVVGFGVPLEFVQFALTSGTNGLRVNSILERGGGQ
jgi:hypothetical protein